MAIENLLAAHKCSANNKKELKKSEKCGCFYCLRIFAPKEIDRFLKEGDGTALCPYCDIDSVIGDASGYPIEEGFLREMNEYWFG